MAKVSIATLDKAPLVEMPEGFAGHSETQAFFDQDGDPLHLHLHRLEREAGLRVGPKDTDCVLYVWAGAVETGGRLLAQGSSLIVEHGATLDIKGAADNALVLIFSAAHPSATPRAGGQVHLLPTERVPRAASLSGAGGTGGGMHANSGCPTCEVWLHENSFPATEKEMTAEDAERGIHSHSENEIIFVVDGGMRLGTRLYGPGTALAILADTLYSFTPGPDGLKFINFRAGRPSEIKFKSGGSMDEVGFWRDRLPAPDYLAPVPG